MILASEWSGWLKIGAESWACSSEEVHFPNMRRTPGLIPSTTHKKEREKDKKREKLDLRWKLNKGSIHRQGGG